MLVQVVYLPVSEGSAESEIEAAELTPNELQCASRFGSPKRRSEWIAGRQASKQALIQLSERLQLPGPRLRAQTLELLSGPEGKPILSGLGDLDFGVSITHSGGLAGAAAYFPASGGPVGLDAERVRKLDFEISKMFCNEAELEALRSLGDENDRNIELLRLWAAKEAVFKAGFGSPELRAIRFSEAKAAGTIAVSAGFRVDSAVVGQHMIALAVPGGWGERGVVHGLWPPETSALRWLTVSL